MKNFNKKKYSNAPRGILSAWSALEVLNPEVFTKKTDLAIGFNKEIEVLSSELLPWENTDVFDENTFYHVILGAIDAKKAMSGLMEIYGDLPKEIRPLEGYIILASLIVNSKGIPIEKEPLTVSSFSWGLGKALSGKLKDLQGWSDQEKIVVSSIEKKLDVFSKLRTKPLTWTNIEKIYNEELIKILGLEGHKLMLDEPKFSVKEKVYAKKGGAGRRTGEVPEQKVQSLILNSFYLEDLDLARSLFDNKKEPTNLLNYLRAHNPKVKADLNTNKDVIKEILNPSEFPLSRWPGKGRHPLTLQQQVAINISKKKLKNQGLVGVNGPPGTGKTTLLRDIVSSIITDRAYELAKYSDPEKAFTETDERVNVDNIDSDFYELNKDIKGYEIFVTSSNNSAVENISAELPGIDAVDKSISGLRYFQCLSEDLLGKDSWGLIAAVLGNSSNRYNFKSKFWDDKDVSLKTYLSAINGKRELIKDFKEVNGEEIEFERVPKIVSMESPPLNRREALLQWEKTRTEFLNAFNELKNKIDEYKEIKEYVSAIDDLEVKIKNLRVTLSNDEELKDQIEESIRRREGKLVLSDHKKKMHEADLNDYSYWSLSVLKKIRNEEWRDSRKSAVRIYKEAKRNYNYLLERINENKKKLELLCKKLDENQRKLHEYANEKGKLRKYIDNFRQNPGGNFVSDDFFNRSREEYQKEAPWFSKEVHEARDELFVKAIELHKAFIGGAAKPISNNLSILMNFLSGHNLKKKVHFEILNDLWSTLFLVVPVISSTFASVNRMLGNLKPEALGWLLIDEAGQALPQAAVGAIMRSKRAVVVGDPLQIEPIVTLPQELTNGICETLDVDPGIYNAPLASVQTLVDAITPYGTVLSNGIGNRSVGIPLFVHRRCSNPMFSISNTIAYDKLMVQGKEDNHSSSLIKRNLGPSGWFNVEGASEEKWCFEEGECLGMLLQDLMRSVENPDLFIISPFVRVAENVRAILRKIRKNPEYCDRDIFSEKWLRERVGTVHVAQGKEAEAVIFVLGAQGANEVGARNWAGSRPNLLNVAVTRAKEAIYVIGNRNLWQKAGYFSELARQVPERELVGGIYYNRYSIV